MDNKTQKMNIALSLTAFAVVIVIVCVVGIYTFNHREPEIVQGQAEANEYRVSSKVPGRILKIMVQEGQFVKAGDTLAILDTPDISAKQAQAEAVLSAATAQNAKAQKGAREEEIQGAYEIWQKAKAGLEIYEKSYRRVENLFSQGVVSEQKRDEAKAQYDAAVATEKAAKSQYDMAVNGAEKEIKEMAAAQMRQAQGVVAEVNSYIEETVLTASMDGEVSEIFPMVGELVGTGAPVMNIAVMDDMWVTFNVREDLLRDLTMGAVREAYIPALDRKVDVKVTYMRDLGSYAAWKATKVNGQYDLKTFEVRAVPQEKVENLRPGMTVIIDRK
ncbi:MAG: efflux RND transporter periplasmic adaptor subunit [Bacteroidaceae bacterium]|nr:efflux RND transporter periplasmic adaptor subunit [Bacteroidaceae bacterium]